MGLAADTAGRYLAALSRGNFDEVLSFFDEDAVLYWRDREFSGRSEIAEFYEHRLSPAGVVFTDLTFMEDGLASMVRATAVMDGGLRREEIVDAFALDESGAVVELRIFFRNYSGDAWDRSA